MKTLSGPGTNSISKALLLFYLLTAGHYCTSLFGRQVKDFIRSNRAAQHILGYVTMSVIISQLGHEVCTMKLLSYSFLAYSWFVLSTKLDIQISIIIYGVLLLGFLIEDRLAHKEQLLEKTQTLSEEELLKVKKTHTKIRAILVFIPLVLTLLGTYLYMNKKAHQYNNDFDMYTFLIKGPNPRNMKRGFNPRSSVVQLPQDLSDSFTFPPMSKFPDMPSMPSMPSPPCKNRMMNMLDRDIMRFI